MKELHFILQVCLICIAIFSIGNLTAKYKRDNLPLIVTNGTIILLSLQIIIFILRSI